jgi:hypothetical protein
MSSFDEVKLTDVLHGSFATFNPNTGANKDADLLPELIVYEEGSSTALTTTNTVTNITTGRYRWQVTVETSAGFEVGKFYEVWIAATVTGTDTVSQVAPVTSFRCTTLVGDDLSTLTQTQVTGGAYALNSASFAFDAALDFTTTQKAATLARVTLVDTTTTNSDMRGTDNAALAATALSTAQWTNTLATNFGTTNTTVATNLNATIDSRMATYVQPTGFLAATFPATIASTTNITAGTITTTTNLTNLPAGVQTSITNIEADTNELQADWANNGRLDLILDARASQASVDAMAIVASKIGSVVFGTVSGAGTATEVFVGAGITTTVTVDVDGNRSNVVFS